MHSMHLDICVRYVFSLQEKFVRKVQSRVFATIWKTLVGKKFLKSVHNYNSFLIVWHDFCFCTFSVLFSLPAEVSLKISWKSNDKFMKQKQCITIKKNCFNYEQTLGIFFLTSVFEIKATSKKQLNEQMLSNLNNHSLGLPFSVTSLFELSVAQPTKLNFCKKEWILQKTILFILHEETKSIASRNMPSVECAPKIS